LFTTALKNKNENICIELLIRGAGQSFNAQRESMVEVAIRSKKSNLVRQYVESGIDLKKEYYHGNLLHSAVHAGILEMVQLFVQSGVDLNLRASGFHIPWSLTPLELACLLPIPEEISIYLVGLVSNITRDHPLAVSFAALTNKLEFLSAVASSGVDVDACVPDMKSEKPLPFRVRETPLLSVIRCTLYRSFRFIVNLDTRQEALQILLEYGANPNVMGADGLTPLQMAIYGENRDLSVPLILYGADLTVREKSGTTLLQLVSRQGDLSLIRLLISQGVNVNEVSGVYRTALHAAFIKAIPPAILFDSRGSPIDPYKDFFEQSDGDEDFSWSSDDEQSKEDDDRPADGNAVVKKGLDHVNSTSHPSHPEGSISGDSLDSILRGTLLESEYTAPNASWAFEPRAHWPKRRLRPSSLREQLRAGIKLPALFESDQRSAAFFVLVECGAIFDRGHYSGIDDDEIDTMELLFTACLEQLKSPSSDRDILGRFNKRSKHSWEGAERLFITRCDGYTMVKYLLNMEEGVFPWEDKDSRG
jgi:ankyrin repeat protein